ncbi:YncE family protein [Actinoalloteichus caeruleus]|uniref:YncE family protein n=1 Tax=Actinoalloteichus cyanogriseus TaxID=2893586 RepID=UPI0004AA78AB|nr:hypothetical protein [Actinoalloteichus caeruleus]
MVDRRSMLKLVAAGGVAGGLGLAGAGSALAGGHRPRPGSGRTGDILALVEKGSHQLSFFDTASGERQTTIGLPDYPHEMVSDRRKRYAFIGHYGVRMSGDEGQGGNSVLVVDLQRRRLVRTISTGSHNRIHGLAVDRQDRLFVLSEGTNTLLVFDDPLTDTRPAAVLPTGGRKTHMVAVTRDGERAFATGLESNSVSVVRPWVASVGPRVVGAGALPEGCSLSEDERTLYVGARQTPAVLEFDTASMRLRRSFPINGDPLRVYAIRKNRLLITDIQNNQVHLYTRDYRHIASITMRGIPASAILHPDEDIALIPQFETSTVSTIDLTTNTVIGEFDCGTEPDGSVLLVGGSRR